MERVRRVRRVRGSGVKQRIALPLISRLRLSGAVRRTRSTVLYCVAKRLHDCLSSYAF